MSKAIDRCQLAPDFSISRVLTGLWQIADMERDGATVDTAAAASAMAPYADLGLTTFDMADHYGSAEEIAGHFLESRRRAGGGAVELLTKWVPKPGALSRDDVREAVERALRRLRTDRIDLLQYHAWNYADARWLDGLFWLQELKHEGLIRHLGVTNLDTRHLSMALASGIEIVSNQVSFSLVDQRARGAMSGLCAEHGVKLLAFGTLAGGLLTDRWLGKPEPDAAAPATWSQMKYRRFIDVVGGWSRFQRLLTVLRKVGDRHQVSIANVACRAILDQPAVAGVIIGARLGERHHRDDAARLFGFSLDEESRDAIDRAVAELEPVPGDCGDEYRKPPFLTASGDLSHHLDSMPPAFDVTERPDGRKLVLSGTSWETLAGYCRAVRHGDRILVSGTTATHGDRVIGGDDPAAQTHFIIDKIEGTLHSLGAGLCDIVRTRVFVRDLDDWEPVARAHGERFADIQPANTLVQAGLVGAPYRVEVEAEAIVRDTMA